MVQSLLQKIQSMKICLFVFTVCINYMYIVYNYMSHYINVGYGISISMKGLYPGHNDSQ